MKVEYKIGSGRAHCKICKEQIKKGQNQITMYSYRDCGSIHGDSKDCKRRYTDGELI